jgi:hypothetical protein
MHKMRQWEMYLNTAKAKVIECEEVLLNLQREVEESEGILARIESGQINLRQAMLQAENHDSESVHRSTDNANISEDPRRHQQLDSIGSVLTCSCERSY